MKSKDGLTKTQANKFVKMACSLSNLRLENGIWVADNDDNPGQPYQITLETFQSAVREGDIK